MEQNFIKPPVEVRCAEELAVLAQTDTGKKPENWKLSPKAVRTFILGGEAVHPDGSKTTISRKFYGNDALVERCIITLAGSRGLMLVGEPGTAKTMLSELLSAAICGVSTNTVQGTAGTTEDMIKYSWNYALLLSKGPSREALVPAPLLVGMEKGIFARFEEITRTPAEIQDSLISVMSDKILNIPELGDDGFVFAKPGFNIIGTANTRDKGVNEMSGALKRRFNFETVAPIRDVRLEKEIIVKEAQDLARAGHIDCPVDTDVAELLAVTYHELREGVTAEGTLVDRPAAVMSTAEAVSVYFQTLSHAWYYDDGRIDLRLLTENLLGAVCKENRDDLEKLKGYFHTAVKEKSAKEGGLWKAYYETGKFLK
ncbi:MAG: AAA family ATPase [Oscillospiraceae bacterium]|nr:AAA family ATPase [Oscillospiraceae bacterium]MBQ9110171.1 AAA family ATPase [Oscillospiraceae bacterium]